ncbi:MAG: agmatinase [Deferribacterota bacterium]|nr:agmatinase [Deferribacterota bacterium]
MEDFNNFCGLESKFSEYTTSNIVILPVPYEKTTSWAKGTAKAPEAIIEASKNMELYCIETESEVYRKGIFTSEPLCCEEPNSLFIQLDKRVKDYYKDNKYVVSIGGEHTITAGLVKSYNELYDNLSVVIFDAHTDLRDEYEGEKFSHACVSKRILDYGIRPLQIGIRSMDLSEKTNIDDNYIYYAKNIKCEDSSKWLDNLIGRLKENVYISIDLDVLDPSEMPSVGTPEPGGLGWYDIIEIIRRIASSRKIISFDVVELCPNELLFSNFTAAKLIYTTLSYINK